MESIFATSQLTASTINSLYVFLTKLTSRAERIFHLDEAELAASVIGILVILLVLVILWKRRVDRHNERVWRAGQYTANDPYKDAGKLNVVPAKDPWLVADPIGGPEVGEAMKVASLTEFMQDQAQAEQPSPANNPAGFSPLLERPSRGQHSIERFPEGFATGSASPTARSGPEAYSAPMVFAGPAANHVSPAGQSVEIPPAGWYPDPSGLQAMMRYWDGNRWTGSISRANGDT